MQNKLNLMLQMKIKYILTVTLWWRGGSVASVSAFGPGVGGSSPTSDYCHVPSLSKTAYTHCSTDLNRNGMDMEYWITDKTYCMTLRYH